ncbi:MAG: hypothetical protein M0R17_11000 [Candidatus Omnitrophica bacterium]|jgi:hypothetical protein|nr:hypothetical protein [Candidatus Omnitrophota bacterium]
MNEQFIIKGNRISTKEMRDIYFSKHKVTYFNRLLYNIPITEFLIKIGKNGYWLNEIILLNKNKNFNEIRKELLVGSSTGFTRDTNGNILSVIIPKYNYSKIRQKIILP